MDYESMTPAWRKSKEPYHEWIEEKDNDTAQQSHRPDQVPDVDNGHHEHHGSAWKKIGKE